MAVDHLETGLRGSVRTNEHLEGIRDIAGTKFPDILCVDSIGQTELFAYGDLRGCRGGKSLGRGSE